MKKHPASMTAEERDSRRYRRPGWAAIRLADGLSVVYYGKNGRGQPAAVAYQGKAIKPAWCYCFRDEARRAAYVQSFVEQVTEQATKKAERKAARKAFRHSLQVGDVLRSMWGYDQTNVDYYQVTRTTAKCAWIRPIGRDSSLTGDMQGDCVPMPGRFTGPETRHVVTEGNRVKVYSFAWASKVEPRMVGTVKTYSPDHWTAYA